MRLILLGPPGAGKGTQAARISESLSVPRVASGDLFRDHQRRDTELGRMARSYMERGVYVPDDVTIGMVMEWIKAHRDAGGFLLDGFPRTLAQAEALDEAMAAGGGIDRALNIEVGREELVRRLTDRLICRECQTPHSQAGGPADAPGRCERCGGELYRRPDDEPKAVRKRLEVYAAETKPLIGHYRKAGILREIDGEGSVEEVERAALEALEG